ncbi:MAG TPA: hypothetical protein VGM56_33255 [Byssovorax sp.]
MRTLVFGLALGLTACCAPARIDAPVPPAHPVERMIPLGGFGVPIGNCGAQPLAEGLVLRADYALRNEARARVVLKNEGDRARHLALSAPIVCAEGSVRKCWSAASPRGAWTPVEIDLAPGASWTLELDGALVEAPRDQAVFVSLRARVDGAKETCTDAAGWVAVTRE